MRFSGEDVDEVITSGTPKNTLDEFNTLSITVTLLGSFSILKIGQSSFESTAGNFEQFRGPTAMKATI